MRMYNEIESLKILTRTKNSLKSIDVTGIRDFERITYRQLLNCSGIGKEALIELLEIIQLTGVKLKSES